QLSLFINEKGLKKVISKGMQAQNPIAIDINRDISHNYQLSIKGNASVITLLPKLKLLTQKQVNIINQYQLIDGQSPFSSRITLNDQGKLQKLAVNSSLIGSSINAFSSLVKGKNTTLPFSLDYTDKTHQLNLQFKKRLNLSLALTDQGNLKGILIDNRGTGKTYQSGLAQLYLKLATFNYNRFNDFKRAFTATFKANKGGVPALSTIVNVDINSVDLGNNLKSPVKLSGNLQNLRIDSPLLTGKVNYQKNHLSAQLSRVAIDKLFAIMKKIETNPEGREVTVVNFAKRLPEMQITADKLFFKDKMVGKGMIKTSILDGRYSIDQIFIEGSHYYAEASGYEADEPQGITTHLQADFKSEDLRSIIDLFQLNPSLSGKFLDLSVNLSWPGRAHTINLRQSYGKADLRAQNIKLRKVSSGVVGIFSLIDIPSIFKRISLGFKNLNSSKISFDTVNGHWSIGGGRAMTRDAYATGSLIELNVIGAVDLHRRLFDDINMTVIPKASNIIPVVGAMAGGIIGATIGIFVQQIAGNTMNKVGSIPYVISGPWNKPIMTSGNTPPNTTNSAQTQTTHNNQPKATTTAQQNTSHKTTLKPPQPSIILESLAP
ncbi:MAG: YhdP family protein, partial [Ostreibacterium sp.]